MNNNCTIGPFSSIQNHYKHFLIRILIISFFSLGYLINTLSQEDRNISKPSLKLSNDSLIIEYKITSYKPDDKFKVWLEITDANGAFIKPNFLSGDIGDSISGDSPKKIIWNLAADSIYVNIDLSVEIFATRIEPPPEPPLVVVEKKDTMSLADSANALAEKTPPVIVNEKKETVVTSVKLGSNLLLSTVFPGWGLTRLSDGKPYWLIGVASAGCLASSVYLNKAAARNLDKYLESFNEGESDSYFNTGQKQYNASKALAWTAAAIWAVDLGLVWMKASKMKKSQSKSKLHSFSVGSSFDYSANTTVVSFLYTF